MRRRDARVNDAVELIDQLAGQVAWHIDEAIAARVRSGFEASERDSEAGDTARRAILLIRASRHAWRILMEPGRATANGVPARLVDLLTRLEGATLERFPLAVVPPGAADEP